MTNESTKKLVHKIIAETPITDLHTHVYDPAFGDLLLWGIDDLLTYHYLLAETMRWVDISYDDYWKMSKRAQADLVWKTLFIDHSPLSESTRGVLAILKSLGLDVASRNLEDYRAYFAKFTPEGYIDRVLEIANIESVVMTNDPFDEAERQVWLDGFTRDPRFYAALRMDAFLSSWETAVPRFKEWGYNVSIDFSGDTFAEVRRFMLEWIDRMDAIYMAVSLPPSFAFPEDSARGKLIAECVLPVARETGLPFATMIGVKKLTNPDLRAGGDSAAKGNIDALENLASKNQDVKFLVTMLARENQHELTVLARKFRNIHVFGCWWFTNSPLFINEMTRMRMEWLGLSFTPQHSDARVLDQVIYKFAHTYSILGDVLAEKYSDTQSTGWIVTEEEIRRDVAGLLGGNFWEFVSKGS